MKMMFRAVIAFLMAVLCIAPCGISAAGKTTEASIGTDIETERLYIQVNDPIDDSVFTKKGQTVELVIMDYGKPEQTKNILFGCSNGEVVHITGSEVRHAVIETGSMPLEGDALCIGLEAKNNGTADLRIQTADQAEEILIHMTVNDNLYAVSSITFDQEEIKIEPEQTATITYTIKPETASNKTVEWKSDHPEIATVSNGVVTGVKEGTAVITGTTADGGYTDTCKVIVEAKKVLEKITLSDDVINLLPGKSSQLKASLVPANAENVNLAWTSSNTAVATVSADGKVTAVKEGSAVITVKNTIDGKSASCQVNVVKKIAATPVDMFRLYNKNSGEHFYTANQGECDTLVAAGWIYEGIGWTAPSKSHTPVYRLYNKFGGEHHYTVRAKERDALVKAGWTDEGIGWYSDDEQTAPVYREYNPNARANNHNYTPSVKEHNALISYGWNDEGIGWYALAQGKPAVKVASLGRGDSPFFIKVNRIANTVTIYAKDADGRFTTAYKALVCSCGVSAHRTPLQNFVTGQKLRWHALIHSVYGQYCTRFAGNSKYRDILFHSVPYKKNGDPSSLKYDEYNKLGDNASAGCVRLCVRDAKWIYDFVPQGTSIVVYEDSNPGPLGKPSAIKINTSSPNRGWDPTDPDPKNPWN